MKSIKYLIVHCSANKTTDLVTLESINHAHKRRGFRCIGYHYLITYDGVLHVGRQEHEQGAHVKGYNGHSLGICMAGGLDSHGKPHLNYNKNQMTMLVAILKILSNRYPEAKILGHRDLSPDLNNDGVISKYERTKECPCFDVIPWWAKVKGNN